MSVSLEKQLASDAVGLAATLMKLIAKHGFEMIYVIDKGYWTRLIDGGTKLYGISVFKGEGFEVVISRHGFPWGYLRAKVFDCYLEGILKFRQKRVLFKPTRFEGECRLYEAQADALGAQRGGVEVVEPEEADW